MGFNTYGRTSKTYGGSLPIFLKVDATYPGGGTVDISAAAAGVVYKSGSMCYLDKQGGTLVIVASTDTENLTKVNGLLLNDIVKEDGGTAATGAVVTAGSVYADRIDVPDSVQALLKTIHFIK